MSFDSYVIVGLAILAILIIARAFYVVHFVKKRAQAIITGFGYNHENTFVIIPKQIWWLKIIMFEAEGVRDILYKHKGFFTLDFTHLEKNQFVAFEDIEEVVVTPRFNIEIKVKGEGVPSRFSNMLHSLVLFLPETWKLNEIKVVNLINWGWITGRNYRKITEILELNNVRIVKK